MTANNILNLNNLLKPQISNDNNLNNVFDNTFKSKKDSYTTNIESNFSNVFENAKKSNVASKNKDFSDDKNVIKNTRKINSQQNFNKNNANNDAQKEKTDLKEDNFKISEKNISEEQNVQNEEVDDDNLELGQDVCINNLFLNDNNVNDVADLNESGNNFQAISLSANQDTASENQMTDEIALLNDKQNVQTAIDNGENLSDENSTTVFLNAEKTNITEVNNVEQKKENDFTNLNEKQTIKNEDLTLMAKNEKTSEIFQEYQLDTNQNNENYLNEIKQINNQEEKNVSSFGDVVENVENEVNKNYVSSFENEKMSNILSENDVDLKELNVESTQLEIDLDSSNEDNSASEDNQNFSQFFGETSAKYNFENTNNISFNQSIKIDNVSQMNIANKLNQNVSSENISKENILNQITNKLENLNDSQSKVNIVLRPENLGRLQLEIVSDKNGTISANLTATNEDVKQLLEKSINELKNSLNSQGVNVSNINIKVENTNQASNNGLNYQHQNNENLNNGFSFNGEARNNFNSNKENQNSNYANNSNEMKSLNQKTNENLNSDIQNSSERLVDLKV